MIIHSVAKRLLLVAALFMPVQPVCAVAATAPKPVARKKLKRNTVSPAIRLARRTVQAVGNSPQTAQKVWRWCGHNEYVATPSAELAKRAYGNGPSFGKLAGTSNFIQNTERSELLIDDTMRYLGSLTHTSLGYHAFASMISTFDKEHMLAVQGAVRRLAEDDQLYEKMGGLLERVKEHEADVLAYWDPIKRTPNHLFGKAQELKLEELWKFEPEFELPFLSSELGNGLSFPNPAYLITVAANTLPIPKGSNSRAAGARVRMFGKTFHWVYAIMIKRAVQSLAQAYLTGDKLHWPIQNSKRELLAALAVTFLFWKKTNAYHKLKTTHDDATMNPALKRALMQDRLRTLFKDGSYADLMGKVTNDCSVDREVSGGEEEAAIARRVIAAMPDSVRAAGGAVKGFFTGGSTGAATARVSTFAGNAIRFINQYDPLGIGLSLKELWDRSSYALKAFNESLFGVAILHDVWNQLQDHADKVADSLRAIRAMHRITTEDAAFKVTPAYESFELGISCADKPLIEAMQIARTKAFTRKLKRGGKCIRLHENMLRSVRDMRNVMHGVAYLDAVYALATAVRAQDGCFVEWLPDTDEKAVVDIEDGIFLSVNEPIANTVRLGNGHSNKAILTGPNGAGKSIFIKMVGSNVVLAHAFGIAFAQKARMHWISCLRTSIDAGESVADELSRMQAEKVRMDSIMHDLVTTAGARQKGMFLTDEPLSGTTHTIAARKLRAYCEQIGDMQGLCGVMATHNEEPTRFVDKGFVNYQVCVEELASGMFKPLFKVKPGIPEWWFAQDEQTQRKQDLFVEWTVAQKHKSNLLKEIQQLQSFAEQTEQLREQCEQVGNYDALEKCEIDLDLVQRAIVIKKHELAHVLVRISSLEQ